MADDGDAVLKAMIDKLRSLGKDGLRQAAEAARLEVIDAVEQTARAGEDANGNPWPLRKDGEQAMPKAANYITGQVIDGIDGPAVQLKVTGPYAINHHRKKPRRRILPIAGEPIPKSITDAMAKGAKRAFEKHLKG